MNKLLRMLTKMSKLANRLFFGNGIVQEVHKMVWEGDGMVLEGDGMVWEGEVIV